jgi:hypothetical protein
MCVISLCTRDALDSETRGRSTAALGVMDSPPEVRMHEEHFSLVHLGPEDALPTWIGGKLWSLMRSPAGISVFCESRLAPAAVVHSKDWACLEFLRSSVANADAYLSAITTSLRSVKADVFAVSALEADYFFVRAEELGRVIGVLSRDGYLVRSGSADARDG